MRDVAARKGRHRDNGDRAAVGQLHGLLIDLRQIGVERTGHRVLRRNLIHTVRYDGQRIGVKGHVRQQHQHLFTLIDGEIFGGGQGHVRHEQTLHRGILRGIDERNDAIERTGVFEHLLEVEEVVVRETHAAQDDLVGLGTQGHIGHHGVIGLIRVGEEGNLLARHDRIIEVDAGDTRGDQLRRLDAAERIHRRTADFAGFALDLLAALDGFAVGVEETARQVVRNAQLRGFAVENYLRIGGNTLRARENLQSHLVAHNLHHLGQLAAYGGQLVITHAFGTQRHGRLGNVFNLGIYLLKCSCCHTAPYLDSFSLTVFSI